MRRSTLNLLLCAAVALAGPLTARAHPHGHAPADAPAGTTAQCKDGSYDAAARRGAACKGHRGVKTWYGAGHPASGSPAGATLPAVQTQSARVDATQIAPSPGGPDKTPAAGAAESQKRSSAPK